MKAKHFFEYWYLNGVEFTFLINLSPSSLLSITDFKKVQFHCQWWSTLYCSNRKMGNAGSFNTHCKFIRCLNDQNQILKNEPVWNNANWIGDAIKTLQIKAHSCVHFTCSWVIVPFWFIKILIVSYLHVPLLTLKNGCLNGLV